jgi:hypothetical protein
LEGIVHGGCWGWGQHPRTPRLGLLRCSKKGSTLTLSSRDRPSVVVSLQRLSPPPPPLVDSAQGSNALGFFLARPRGATAKKPTL